MSIDSGTNPIWNVMLALTVLAGGTACFIALKRGDFFPSVYNKHDFHNNSTLESKHNEAVQNGAADTLVQKEQTVQKNLSLAGQPSQFVLVAGSFVSNERASHFRESIAQQFPKSEVVPFIRSNKQFYHVLIGRAENKETILDMQKKMTGLGFNDCWFYQLKDSL